MYAKRITVISASKSFLRFFELELSSMGAYVNVSKSNTVGRCECDLLIIDLDTVGSVSDTYPCPVIRVSQYEDKSEDAILWPISISEFEERCHKIFQSPERDMSEKNEDTLFVVDKSNGIVMLGRVQIHLSRTELAVIDELCSNCAKTVTRQRIMEIIGAKTGNNSDVYICMLRKKLESPFGKRLIFTERSVGYYTHLRIVK